MRALSAAVSGPLAQLPSLGLRFGLSARGGHVRESGEPGLAPHQAWVSALRHAPLAL